VVNKIKYLSATECVIIDISGANTTRIISIKQGIRSAFKRAGFTVEKLRIAVKNNEMFVWTNN
jgi:uncharacterized protein (DUF362 family)